MTSTTVAKEIKSIIRPVLRESGFINNTGKKYWRHKDESIDVIDFMSFNSYNADIIGCTTFSIAIKLGCYFNFIPHRKGIKEKNGLLFPEEWQCDFRGGGITKEILQPELESKEIWYIDESGSNLNEVVLDCKKQLQEKAFVWFNQFDEYQNIYDILLNHEDRIGVLWGFGRKDSPLRNFMLASIEIKLKKFEKAEERLVELVKYYDNLIQTERAKDLKACYIEEKGLKMELLEKTKNFRNTI